MWKQYAGQDSGVAVQSTFSRLQHAFDELPDRFYLGRVQYGADLKGIWNSFFNIMNKRQSFQHEQEVRGLIWRTNNYSPESERRFWTEGKKPVPLPAAPPNTPKGIRRQVNLSRLVTRVVVSPNSPAWLPEVIQSVVKRYDYSFEVRPSDIYKLKYVPSQ